MNTAPRSARNNNPLNIRVGDGWVGLLPRSEMTPEQAAETAFCVFSSATWGFRAAAICIRNPIQRGDTKTLADVIKRWAPATENDTLAYIGSVSERSGIRANALIDPKNFNQMFALMKAMTIHETGAWEPWFEDSDLDDGLEHAGIKRTNQGAMS